MGKKLAVLTSLILSSCSMASDNSIAIPESDTQRSIAGNISLSTESFFKAYMSPDVAQRRFAEMYLIGVMDGSEGESWCGYQIASPNAIQEQVYIGIKKSLKLSPKERASTAIKARLKELLPCKEEK